ncbi:hypothetical protein PLESTB_000841000 [Pleodorina starrii]|uniref:Uncharacterized protein n=1 Tax=Pleodorina starrii TaxID=330485 RepID=A0A9W6BMG7_9CHLO|nr:hypothetical protein PLESTM_000156800 [Pleodorina starrii]GLC54262.1 hypothetical protein PLESTB_000841000 [Pleodorina starrii]GLC64437.1 hypothetical protein PLESTF_000165900 [Pleodorina starrii]
MLAKGQHVTRPAAARRPGQTVRPPSLKLFASLVKTPVNPYRIKPGAGGLRPTPAAAASQVFGQRRVAVGGQQQQQQHQQSRPGGQRRGAASSGPWIHVAAYRRGATLVVCTAMAPTAADTAAVESLLHRPIKREPELVVGYLENGMQYVLLPNKLPPKRFEAHLEVHVGSVDEREDEQGVAHLVEHVTFLGSKRREALLGTGARANAYTDFHHTVFHVHAPAVNSITGQPMLPQVLEALEEIAFQPQFSGSRIEKERKAVLAEAQMMNTIEYRVDCQLLTYLHEENALGCRFPIGLTEQVKSWPHETLRGFWERWYFPANVTLYVVGDLERSTQDTIRLIEKTFGKVPPGREPPPPPQALPPPLPTAAAAAAAGGNGNGNGNGSAAAAASSSQQQLGALKVKHAVRPPVEHKWGHGPLKQGEQPAEVKVFRHPLLQHFMLSVFCKLPIQPLTEMAHLKQLLMLRIILSVFQFRINGRYVTGQPPFLSIALDISDSGREGCAVSTLTITSEPADWRGAVAVAVQEMRRMQRHGLTQGEFDRYRQAILRDSAQLAEQANKIPSVDTLNFVMESLACGHTVMGHRDAHEAMNAVANTVELWEVNALARSMLTFASDYGAEAAVLAEAEAQGAADPGLWAYLGPTRCTSIVACIPAYVDASGMSVSAGSSAGRGGSLGAAGHLDADQIDLEQLEKQSQQIEEFEVPEGAVKFDPSPAEIAAALADTSLDCTAADDVELPDSLISPEQLQALVDERRPQYVSVVPGSGEPFPPPDPHSGIVQRRLSNGISLNYRYTDNEPRSGLLRLIANGGRIAERPGVGQFGRVVVGSRTLSESGAVGPWGREQVEVFCVANLVNCALEADEENIVMDFHFSAVDGGMEAMFQMVHLFLESPRWEEGAMERAKLAFLASVKSVHKSLERATSDRVRDAMLGRTERCFRDPTPEELEALTLEGMREAVSELLTAGNFEISVVGDFDAAELEALVLHYVGTVAPRPAPQPLFVHPIEFKDPPPTERHQMWHLKDSDERAVAYIGGPAPARWGPLGYFGELQPLNGPVRSPVQTKVMMDAAARADAEASRRNHPLFASVMLMLLTEIINSRLFTTVRDSLGLTYDVSFEVTLFDRIRSGWYMVHVTSHPDKIYEALNASVAVLRDIRWAPVNRRELARAKTTLLTRHESDLKDNAYWLGLLTHLQNPHVPHKTLECLRDLQRLYDAATVDDIKYVYEHFNFDDDHIYTCVGTSGKEAPPAPEYPLGAISFGSDDSDEAEEEAAAAGAAAGGTGTTGGSALPNPMALFTAWMAAAQAQNIRSAVSGLQQQGPPGDGQAGGKGQ